MVVIAAVWVVWAVLAALWTLGAVVTVEFMQWALGFLSSDEARELGRAVGEWPAPRWMEIWIDPVWMARLQSFAQWLIETARESLPVLGVAVGWLVPLVWVGWGLGLVLMLAVALGAHFFIKRVIRAPAAAQ